MNGVLPDPKWIVYYWRNQVWYYCEEDVVFNSHDGSPIVIPAYYLHNGGSIPWVFTKGLKKNGLMLTAYALHDFTYTKDFPHNISRKIADNLLWVYGDLYGYNRFKLRSVRIGVGIGGWRSWKKHDAYYLDPKTNLVYTK